MIFSAHKSSLSDLLKLRLNPFSERIVADILKDQSNQLQTISGCFNFGEKIATLRSARRFLPPDLQHIPVAKGLVRDIMQEFDGDVPLSLCSEPAFVEDFMALQTLRQEELDRAVREIYNQVATCLRLTDRAKTPADMRAWLDDPVNESSLQSISMLNLYGKKIKILPPEMIKLKGLTRLHLSGNQIRRLPEFLGNFTQLTYLDLSDNRLTSLPFSVIRLAGLTRLILSKNQFSELPDVVQRLSNLKSLEIKENQLTIIPEWIGELKALNIFNAGKNQLTTLPEQMKGLKELQMINLYDNGLTHVPEWIGELDIPEGIELGKNPIQYVPDSLIHSKNPAIFYNTTIREYAKRSCPVA